MATDKRGIPTLSPALIRPTNPTPQPAPDPDPEQPEESAEPADQGRGDQRSSVAPKPRRKRVAHPAEKVSKRGLHLRDDLWERLQLEAIRKKTTVSSIANDLLDRNLARLRIEREG